MRGCQSACASIGLCRSLDGPRARDGECLVRMRVLEEIEFGSTGPHTSDFLHKTQSSPRKLVLWAPRFDLNLPPWRLVLGAHTSFPTVEVLSICDPYSLYFPEPDQLGNTFQNIKVFCVSRKMQQQPPISPTIVWPKLERVRGTVGSLRGWMTGAPAHLLDLLG